MWFFIVLWVTAVIAGHYLGQSRGRRGWAWGFLLGWLGVLILLCMSKVDPTPTLTATELQVRELEAQARLAELQRQLQQSN